MLTGTTALSPRWCTMQNRLMRTLRGTVLLAGVAFALPVTCSQPGDGIYSGGIEPSPASRVNPSEPGFINDGGHSR